MISGWYLYHFCVTSPAHERIDEELDFDKVAEMLRYYETALNNRLEVRVHIAQMLPKEKQKNN